MNPETQPAKSITTLSSREVYRNKWMRLREDEILRSNGEKGIYGVVEKHDGAIILPIEDGRIWLAEQYRYTIGERALELPQGGWEDRDRRSRRAGARRVERRARPRRGQDGLPGLHWIAYGFLRQKAHVFVATGLTAQQPEPDAEEHDLVVRNIPIAEFEQMMLDGTIRDGCTLSAWGMYQLWRSKGTRSENQRSQLLICNLSN